MKRLVMILCLLLAVSPAWALFCQYCGSTMADDAKFCPKCGKNQTVPSSTPQQQPKKTEPVTAVPETPSNTGFIATPEELSSASYEAINRYETVLTTPSSEQPTGTAAECRFRISAALQKVTPEAQRFTPAMQRLHNLYLSKYDLLDRYEKACIRSVRGPSRAEADAEKEKLLFSIARTNEMISYLKDHQTDPAAPARIDEMRRSLDEATREYRITAPYLRLEGYRVNRDQRFWVMDIADDRAMIMVLDDCGSPKALVGWLSLGDLERRSNYRRPASWVAPAPRVEKEVVIIGGDIWWPGWPWPYHRHPAPHGYDHGRHDRDDYRGPHHPH